MTDELEAIRARHEADRKTPVWEQDYGPALIAARIDRDALLRLLDAAREELREVREAASLLVQEIEADEDASAVAHYGRRLAAALKEPPTRAQGESS